MSKAKYYKVMARTGMKDDDNLHNLHQCGAVFCDEDGTPKRLLLKSWPIDPNFDGFFFLFLGGSGASRPDVGRKYRDKRVSLANVGGDGEASGD